MSSELSTFLIEDPRISRITSDIHVAVKDGPASCVIQGYPTNSNSASTTLFNVNVPSENTLVDRNIRVQGTIQCVMELTVGATAIPLASLQIVPSVFPLNQALQSASLTLNNAKVTVQSADVLNIITPFKGFKRGLKSVRTTSSEIRGFFVAVKLGRSHHHIKTPYIFVDIHGLIYIPFTCRVGVCCRSSRAKHFNRHRLPSTTQR